MSGAESRLLDVQLFTYDSLGNPLLTCQDLDLDGEIDLAGPDRVTGSDTSYESDTSDDYWQVTRSWTYPADGSAAPLTNSIARTRLTGLGGAYSADGAAGILAAESVSIDSRGNQTVSRTVTDRAGKTVYRVTDTPDSTVAALSVTVNGLLQTSRSTHNLTSAYAYDALGRQTASQDARGAVNSRGYDGFGRVAWESDPATNGTWYAYDALGRRAAVTNALGQATFTAYDAEGHTVAVWGATYPVAYEYDDQGRMTAMATTRDNAHESVNLLTLLPAGVHLSHTSHPSYPSDLDTTAWFYDEATGLLTNKVYADGKGTAYSYTSDGKLATRTWARGITATYAYTNGSSLASVDYSDATPDVAYAYDRLGRQKVAQTFLSAHHFAYDGLDLVSETIVDPQTGASNVISRSYDTLGRPAGFALDGGHAVSYAYDMFGRFSQVSNFQFQVSYSYLPGSDLLSGMTASSGFLWTRAYESGRSLITSVENRYGGTVISRYDYANDALGRRTSRADSGEAFTITNSNDLAAFNLYGYNGRSEVASAARYWGTDTGDTSEAVDGQQYAYAYDPVGNRVTAAEGDTSRTAAYTANALNQYAQRTVPGVKELAGTALADATVTVNGLSADRHGPWWRHAFEVDNASSAAYAQAVITAVYNPPGTNDPDVVTSQTGRVFVAQTPEGFTYDDDGNLTQDGRFTYTWNGENRLIKAETRNDLPVDVPRVKVEYAYDHQGRRIAAATSTWTNDAWQAVESRAFIYDGWNVIREAVAVGSGSPQAVSTNLYTWGLDLSGSLQGAGGIGGLLAASLGGTTSFYCCDANGNVGQLVSTDGELLAHYEYSPFGETVVSTGPLAKANPFRFSTKHWDDLTGLGYWGYRWYSPGMGRWLSRDPIGEEGGLSLFKYVGNNAVNITDYLGLAFWDWIPGFGTLKAQIESLMNSIPGQHPYDYPGSVTKRQCCEEGADIAEGRCRAFNNEMYLLYFKDFSADAYKAKFAELIAAFVIKHPIISVAALFDSYWAASIWIDVADDMRKARDAANEKNCDCSTTGHVPTGE